MKHIQEFLNKKGASLKVDGIIGYQTIKAAHKYIYDTCKFRNYYMPIKGLVWVRTDLKLTNTFDDFVCLFAGGKIVKIYPATTTAGDFYIFNPLTVGGITGTAIAMPQQVVASHKFVTSSNWKSLWLGMPYFQQVRPILIGRDGNKNRNIDTTIFTRGLFGINFHQMGFGSIIDRWSAGCNGTSKANWNEIIKYFSNGELIDYTLID